MKQYAPTPYFLSLSFPYILSFAVGGLLALFLLITCSFAAEPKAKIFSASCEKLDTPSHFTRCETAEVVCYMSSSGQQCWLKAPPVPSPTPSVSPSPVHTLNG